MQRNEQKKVITTTTTPSSASTNTRDLVAKRDLVNEELHSLLGLARLKPVTIQVSASHSSINSTMSVASRDITRRETKISHTTTASVSSMSSSIEESVSDSVLCTTTDKEKLADIIFDEAPDQLKPFYKDARWSPSSASGILRLQCPTLEGANQFYKWFQEEGGYAPSTLVPGLLPVSFLSEGSRVIGYAKKNTGHGWGFGAAAAVTAPRSSGAYYFELNKLAIQAASSDGYPFLRDIQGFSEVVNSMTSSAGITLKLREEIPQTPVRMFEYKVDRETGNLERFEEVEINIETGDLNVKECFPSVIQIVPGESACCYQDMLNAVRAEAKGCKKKHPERAEELNDFLKKQCLSDDITRGSAKDWEKCRVLAKNVDLFKKLNMGKSTVGKAKSNTNSSKRVMEKFNTLMKKNFRNVERILSIKSPSCCYEDMLNAVLQEAKRCEKDHSERANQLYDFVAAQSLGFGIERGSDEDRKKCHELSRSDKLCKILDLGMSSIQKLMSDSEATSHSQSYLTINMKFETLKKRNFPESKENKSAPVPAKRMGRS